MRTQFTRGSVAAVSLAIVIALTGLSGQAALAAPVTTSAKTYANCDALHKKYPHGVAKKGARDKVSGSTKPVTNFTVNTAVYNANKKSDRDKDGVACEKR